MEKTSKILLNRVQTIDLEERLRDYIGKVDSYIIKQIQESLKVVFDID